MGVVPVRERADEVVRIGRARGLHDLGLARVGLAVQYVGLDRSGEERRLLGATGTELQSVRYVGNDGNFVISTLGTTGTKSESVRRERRKRNWNQYVGTTETESERNGLKEAVRVTAHKFGLARVGSAVQTQAIKFPKKSVVFWARK